MENGLLIKAGEQEEDDEYSNSEENEEVAGRWEEVAAEMKKVGCLAAPMAVVLFAQYMLNVVSTVMVGHLDDELSLSSSALAISFAGVTGFGVLQGLASGLETLAGQAYGAQQFHTIGIYTYTAVLSLITTCLPLSFLWLNADKIFILLGQNSSISHEAGKFLTCLTPAIFAYATLQPLNRYFQSQSMVLPMLISSIAALCIHIPLCWYLVFNTSLANLGTAFATGVSMWINVFVLGLYLMFSLSCKRTRANPFSMEVLYGVKEFFRFAIPSAIMFCLEWWSFECLIILSGLLSNPELETSVLSICFITTATIYKIPSGVGAAGSTRVSNKLGAGNAIGARVTVYGVMTIVVLGGIIICSTLFALRNVYGHLFSNDQEVVSYVTQMTPLLCVSVMVDSLNGGMQGILRGCGLQKIGAWVNLGVYYLFGIPIAVALCFLLGMQGKGLWIGLLLGSMLQVGLLFIVTSRVHWETKATEAGQRFLEGDRIGAGEEIDEERLSANGNLLV